MEAKDLEQQVSHMQKVVQWKIFNGKMNSLRTLKKELSGKDEATNSRKLPLGCWRSSWLRVKTEKGRARKKCSNLDRIMPSRFKT